MKFEDIMYKILSNILLVSILLIGCSSGPKIVQPLSYNNLIGKSLVCFSDPFISATANEEKKDGVLGFLDNLRNTNSQTTWNCSIIKVSFYKKGEQVTPEAIYIIDNTYNAAPSFGSNLFILEPGNYDIEFNYYVSTIENMGNKGKEFKSNIFNITVNPNEIQVYSEILQIEKDYGIMGNTSRAIQKFILNTPNTYHTDAYSSFLNSLSTGLYQWEWVLGSPQSIIPARQKYPDDSYSIKDDGRIRRYWTYFDLINEGIIPPEGNIQINKTKSVLQPDVSTPPVLNKQPDEVIQQIPTPPQQKSLEEKLTELRKLKEKGLITEKEFQKKKEELLKNYK